MSSARPFNSFFKRSHYPPLGGPRENNNFKSSFSKSKPPCSDPGLLTKNCAIILPNDESITVDKYYVAVGEIIGFKNIVFGGRSGQRMVMHLSSEDLVESFIQNNDHVIIDERKFPVKKLVNPGIKITFNHVNPSISNDILYQEISKYVRPISPIVYVHSGLRDVRLNHIFSYKRQVFVQEQENIPSSIKVTLDSEVNTIYLNSDSTIKCYACGLEGHKSKVCPTPRGSKHPAQDRLSDNQLSEIVEISTPVVEADIIDSEILSPISSSFVSSVEAVESFVPSFCSDLKDPTPVVSSGNLMDNVVLSVVESSEHDVSLSNSSVNGETETMIIDDKKSMKRSSSPVGDCDNSDKKAKVESDFHEDFLEALDSSLSAIDFKIPKTKVLRLFCETKNSKNQRNVISSFGFNLKDLVLLLDTLSSCKLSPSMKRRIKLLIKNTKASDSLLSMEEDTD